MIDRKQAGPLVSGATSGNDSLVGDETGNLLLGLRGDDTLVGLAGRDILNGGSGNDLLDGGGGNDSIWGGLGEDTIFGGAGRDQLRGGRGHDSIDAGSGDDRVIAGVGDDVVRGGVGSDFLRGGRGFDTAVFDGSVFDFDWRTASASLVIVQDLNASDGDEGLDIVRGFEALQFGDYLYSLGGPNAALVLADSQTTDEDTATSFTVDAYDFDGGTVSVTGVSVTGGGTLTQLPGSVPLALGLGVGAQFGFSFDPGAAYQSLAVGESTTETATITVSDGQGNNAIQNFDIVITGENDAPVITNVTFDGGVDTVAEDGAVQMAAGAIVASDVDTSDVLSYGVQGTGIGTYGTLSVDPITGVWSYALANGSAAVQALAEGQTVQDTFTVEVDDGNLGTDTETITVNVAGDNDAPAITGITFDGDVDTVVEDGAVQTTGGQINASDNDTNDTLSYGVQGTGVGTYGTLSVNPTTGEWSYTLANGSAAVQALAEGQSVQDRFIVGVDDGNLGTDTETIMVNVVGDNDAPAITGITFDGDVDTVAEDGAVQTTGGQISASDNDTNDTLSYGMQGTGIGTYGTLSVDPATGEWSYALANGSATVQALAEGQTVQDTFTVEVADSNLGTDTETITVNVVGDNEAPVPQEPASVTADEADGVFTIDLRDFVDDPEGGSLSFPLVTISRGSTLIDFAVVGDGIIQIDPSAIGTELNDGDVLETQFFYSVQDDSGDASSDTAEGVVQLTINGADDEIVVPPANTAPTAQAVSVMATEDGPRIEIALADLVTDPDAGDVLTITDIRGPLLGGLIPNQPLVFSQNETSILIDPSQFHLAETTPVGTDPGDPFLGEGELAQLSLTFTVRDAAGETDSNTITLDLTGVDNTAVNTPPVAGSPLLGDVIVDDPGALTQTINLLALVSDPDLDPLTLTPGELRLGQGEGSVVVPYDYDPATGNATITFADLGLADGETVIGRLSYSVTDGEDTTEGRVRVNYVDELDTSPPFPPEQVVLDFEPFAAPDPVNAIPLPVLNAFANDGAIVDSYEGYIFQGAATVIETDEIGGGRGPNGIVLGQTTTGGDNVLVGTSTTVQVPVLDEVTGDPVVDDRGNPVFETVVDNLFGIIAPGSTRNINLEETQLSGFAPAGTPPPLPDNLGTAFNLDGLSLNAATSEDVTVTITTYTYTIREEPFGTGSGFSSYFLSLTELDTFEFSDIDASNAAEVLDFNAPGFMDDLGNTNSAGFDQIYAVSFETSDGSALVFDDILVTEYVDLIV